MKQISELTQDELLQLDNQICFPLYATSKSMINAYRPFLEKLNLTYTQYIVMMVLWEVKDIAIRDLGHRLYLDSGTLTPLLKKLEAKGLLVRFRSKRDERVVNVVLTDKGLDLKNQAYSVPNDMLGEVDGLTMDELMELKQLLQKLHKSLEKHNKKLNPNK